MRVLLVVVVLFIVLGLVGWLQFSTPQGDPTIRIDADKIRRDSAAIVEESERVVEDAARNLPRKDR